MTEEVIVGKPVPWYRANGWIPQNGGQDWMRYNLVSFGLTLVQTPWIFVGDPQRLFDRDPTIIPPRSNRRRVLD